MNNYGFKIYKNVLYFLINENSIIIIKIILLRFKCSIIFKRDNWKKIKENIVCSIEND